MIALCNKHHDQADAGAFTNEQLKSLKSSPFIQDFVSGEFNWRRSKLAVVSGTNLYYNNAILLRINGRDIIWFTDDENGIKLLNIDANAVQMRDSMWIARSQVRDIISPPSGKKLEVRLLNDDFIKMFFKECSSYESLTDQYDLRLHPRIRKDIEFPMTLIEISAHLFDGKLIINSNGINAGISFQHSFFGNSMVCFEIWK